MSCMYFMPCLAQNSTDCSKSRLRSVQVCMPSFSSWAASCGESVAARSAPAAKYVRSKCILIPVLWCRIEGETSDRSSLDATEAKKRYLHFGPDLGRVTQDSDHLCVL